MSDRKTQALGLLEFIADTLQEGRDNPLTLNVYLEEADCALRVLKCVLSKDDMLLPLFLISPLNGIRFLNASMQTTGAEREECVSLWMGFVASTKVMLENFRPPQEDEDQSRRE